MNNLLLVAIKSAVEAGRAIEKIYYDISDLQIQKKSDNSPVTLADKLANDIILEGLSVTNIPYISEESKIEDKAARLLWTKYWLIDPLDGTKGFINKSKEFTVNIALIEDSKSVFGVIYVPITHDLYFAHSSFGTLWCNLEPSDNFGSLDELINKSTKLPLPQTKQEYIVARSVSFQDNATNCYITRECENTPNSKVIQMGSSLKFAEIAKGNIDCYPRCLPIHAWDIAAGVALVQCSGGKVLDLSTNKSYLFTLESFVTNQFVALAKKM